ncbi:MAG: dihydroorotase [Treponema sp.]|nr:dihydroorotase [Treponema sp.]
MSLSSGLLLRDFRLVDETMDMLGSVWIEGGIIRDVFPQGAPLPEIRLPMHRTIQGGGSLALMPALVDLHAHFRDPGYPEKETLESASLAAVAGGYGTVVCMANTKPVMDSPAKARALKKRADALGLVDLYPVLALTQGMEGKALSDIPLLKGPLHETEPWLRMLSEDGKDVVSDEILYRALQEARRLGIPVSCHCDAGGPEAEEAKAAGKPREFWSRIEENHATQRVIELARQAQGHVHIAHVSTREAVDLIRKVKGAQQESGHAVFTLTAEASPHHLCLTEETAHALGAATWGRVNPPLRTEADRRALIEAVLDGTIDAIATDHAPHTERDKLQGAPGFTGLETGFALCRMELVRQDRLSLSRLSSLMSASPARILGLTDRGRVAPTFRGDLMVVDTEALWRVNPGRFRSRGKNSPCSGLTCRGRVLMTIYQGRVVFESFLNPDPEKETG